MRIAYLDCFAGISGDMFLGALLDAGVDPAVLRDATAALGLGATLRIHTVDRSGISCTKVDVMVGDQLAEDGPSSRSHVFPSKNDQNTVENPSKTPPNQQPDQHSHTHQHHPKTQHQHKTGHPHTHEPQSHEHGRSLPVIRDLIQKAALADEVKAFAIRTFELLGASEAKIHNVPLENIHFHEVGAVDAIVDIVAASAGIHSLGISAWFCSSLNVGGGMVQCAHGNFPVPAPATADLLRGIPTYSAHIQKELVTPTGAALIRALNPEFGPQPAMQVDSIGYGAGTRNPDGFPNVLRLSFGESSSETKKSTYKQETVAILETALDDLSPQVIAHVAELALQQGALDVMLTPVIMKKGRPGTLLTILAKPSDVSHFETLIFRETSTLGVRIREERRAFLDRKRISVDTEYGQIRIKTGSNSGEILNAAPEFEDCRAAAITAKAPLKKVQNASLISYVNLTKN